MASVKEIKDLVQETIDKGATTVEEVHQAIARMPIDVLERIAPGLPLTKTVGDVQKKTIGTMYEMIHVVNKTAGDIAEDLLAMARKAKKEATVAAHQAASASTGAAH
jgi:hypothetical protein